ncbi:enoyl-CoA hydratase/isomerase family protein [Nocardia sp. NPDC004123]
MNGPAVLINRDSPVWTLTLNQPHRRNALDIDDRRELLDALRWAEIDPGCRAIVLAGAGAVFCAGADLQSMTVDPEVARSRMHRVNDLARALILNTKPLVAAVNGGAFGLGLALAAGCDYVVAAEDSRFAASFGRVGLTADTGLFWSLPQRTGPAMAKKIILFAEVVGAAEALRIGLVDETVQSDAVLAQAHERARRLAALSPQMVAGTKQIFSQPDQDLASILAAELETQSKLLGTEYFADRRGEFFARAEKKTRA